MGSDETSGTKCYYQVEECGMTNKTRKVLKRYISCSHLLIHSNSDHIAILHNTVELLSSHAFFSHSPTFE